MVFDNSMIVAIVVLVLFGFVYFVLFVGMYRSRKRTILARLEDDDMEEEIYDEYNQYIESKEPVSFPEYVKGKQKKDRKYTIFSGIIAALVSLICIGILVFSIETRARGDQVFFGDTAILVVKTGSMSEKNENNGYLFEYGLDNQIEGSSLVTITKNYDSIDLYDIVAFEGKDGETVIHRVIAINEEEDGSITYNFRGDANSGSLDYELHVTQDRIIGKYTGFQNLFLGQFIMYMQSGIGLISVVVAVVVVLTYYLYCNFSLRLYERRYQYLSSRAFLDSIKWDEIRGMRARKALLLQEIQIVDLHERVVLLHDQDGYHAGDVGTVISKENKGMYHVQMDYGSRILNVNKDNFLKRPYTFHDIRKEQENEK